MTGKSLHQPASLFPCPPRLPPKALCLVTHSTHDLARTPGVVLGHTSAPMHAGHTPKCALLITLPITAIGCVLVEHIPRHPPEALWLITPNSISPRK